MAHRSIPRPPPPLRRPLPPSMRQREEEEDEAPLSQSFDPERPPWVEARPHHFSVNQRQNPRRSAGMRRTEFDQEALRIGAEHELEHTDSRASAERIAMDHLAERPDYYERLEACMPDHTQNPTPIAEYSSQACADHLAFVERVAPKIHATAGAKEAWQDENYEELVRMGVLTALEAGRLRRADAYLARHYDRWEEEQEDDRGRQMADDDEFGDYSPNPSDYYVWVIDDGDRPIEGPYGPFSKDRAKQYARISATQGRHDRAVARGPSPAAEIVRIYEGGTGERLVANASSKSRYQKVRLNQEDIRRALKITREMTDDSSVGYVLMPAYIADTLAKKGLIKIIGPSSYGEVKATITAAGRRWELTE